MMWSKGSQSSGFRLTEVHLRHLWLPVAYDANGNTLSDAQGRSYTWDFENRLTQVVNPGVGTTTFRYDPFGRRIQKSGPLGTTNYLYDGDNSTEEIDQGGNILARYARTTNIDEPLSELRSGTTNFYEEDVVSSTTSLTNTSGSIAATYLYDSFGNLTASSGTLTNPFQYTGREFDSELGQYFYRARYYDQATGRFLREDPMSFTAGPNFYVYALQNPVRYRDPFGLWTVQIGGTICGNIPLWGPVGIGGSGFGGIAYDGHHWAWYWGGGGGVAGGTPGVCGGITIGGSNAHTVCDLGGLFINGGVSGGAGFGGGAEGFAGKDSQGRTIVGGNVMVGGAAGVSGIVGPTYTWVHPFGGKCPCGK
jgi:RHS repeat-associated protein